MISTEMLGFWFASCIAVCVVNALLAAVAERAAAENRQMSKSAKAQHLWIASALWAIAASITLVARAVY